MRGACISLSMTQRAPKPLKPKTPSRSKTGRSKKTKKLPPNREQLARIRKRVAEEIAEAGDLDDLFQDVLMYAITIAYWYNDDEDGVVPNYRAYAVAAVNEVRRQLYKYDVKDLLSRDQLKSYVYQVRM